MTRMPKPPPRWAGRYDVVASVIFFLVFEKASYGTRAHIPVSGGLQCHRGARHGHPAPCRGGLDTVEFLPKLEMEPISVRCWATELPRRLWTIPFLVDQHCHIPASGIPFGATPMSAERTCRALAIRRPTFVRGDIDMGVAELEVWDEKPVLVASAFRGLTGRVASESARLLLTPVRVGSEAGAALEQNVSAGAALAKIIATGSGLAPKSDGVRPVICRLALDDIAATARRLALKFAVHCHGIVERAAEAGVDSSKHGLSLIRAQTEILRERGNRLTVMSSAYLSAKPGVIGTASDGAPSGRAIDGHRARHGD